MFQVRVTISRRPAVFDPEARVITQGLVRLGYEDTLHTLSMHRVFMLELDTSSPVSARDLATQMCEELLVETALEDYLIEVLDS